MRVTVFSNRWRVVYLFSEGFRVQDIATILRVLRLRLQLNARRLGKTRHLDGMFTLCTLLISFERSGKLTNKIPYQLVMLPFLCPVSK